MDRLLYGSLIAAMANHHTLGGLKQQKCFPEGQKSRIRVSAGPLGPSGALGGSVMVNCMCQLDWAIGCPCIWSNIILGISVRVF
jgi:hypothetical protein